MARIKVYRLVLISYENEEHPKEVWSDIIAGIHGNFYNDPRRREKVIQELLDVNREGVQKCLS